MTKLESNKIARVKTQLRKYWNYAGEWHDNDCAFIRLDEGNCNCKTAINSAKVTELLKSLLFNTL